MKGRTSFTQSTTDVAHERTIHHVFKVCRRLCDFCDTQTPLPTKEQLDETIIAAHMSGVPAMVPVLKERDAPISSGYGFRIHGWELLGPTAWACPECVAKAQAALERKP